MHWFNPCEDIIPPVLYLVLIGNTTGLTDVLYCHVTIHDLLYGVHIHHPVLMQRRSRIQIQCHSRRVTFKTIIKRPRVFKRNAPFPPNPAVLKDLPTSGNGLPRANFISQIFRIRVVQDDRLRAHRPLIQNGNPPLVNSLPMFHLENALCRKPAQFGVCLAQETGGEIVDWGLGRPVVNVGLVGGADEAEEVHCKIGVGEDAVFHEFVDELHWHLGGAKEENSRHD